MKKRIAKRTTSALIFAALFVFLPSIANFISDSFFVYYYSNTKVEEFYSSVEMRPADMCLGETEQNVISQRFVNSNIGYAATISRELFQEKDGLYYKMPEGFYEEGPFGVNIEKTEDNFSYRIQEYKKPLPEGVYRWEIAIKSLYLPKGVVRDDVPTIVSEDFVVISCNN